jgi:division protein CdvB (Snf7/Vps24/ESCRT-III family)
VDAEVARNIYDKDSDEILAVKDMEKRIDSYEKYLFKIIKNYENAKEYTVEATRVQETLKAENERLRQIATDQGLNLDEILKNNDDAHKHKASKKEKSKTKGSNLKGKPLSKAFYELQASIKN